MIVRHHGQDLYSLVNTCHIRTMDPLSNVSANFERWTTQVYFLGVRSAASLGKRDRVPGRLCFSEFPYREAKNRYAKHDIPENHSRKWVRNDVNRGAHSPRHNSSIYRRCGTTFWES